MKLTVFQSDKGDCLLLTGDDGKRVLVDGGMRASYSEHVAPALGRLRDEGADLDVVYVSHIDQDHISGVLQLMDDEVEWRVHDFQVRGGNRTHAAPRAPRPPRVKDIWHNAFREQVEDNEGEIEGLLAASAAVLSGSALGEVRELAAQQGDLATSISEAIQLSRRVGPEQLGIKLNRPAKGALMMVRAKPSPVVRVGGMRFRTIGPFEEDLNKLRDEWNAWLVKNKARVKSLQAKAAKDAGSFSTKEVADLLWPRFQQAEELAEQMGVGGDGLASASSKLGERKKVTTPNLASLMFLVEEAGKTVLLTGDGHHSDILEGLRRVRKLKPGGPLHVDVLKVQHHGSEFNIDEEFCRTITANHYVFCGNGEHENPDLRVLRAIAESRVGSDPAKLSRNPAAAGKFKFWFNSSEAATPKASARKYMGEVRHLVDGFAARSGGRMSAFFLKNSSFNINL
ncbi:MAG TPA: MBL fold metallo-hydrolase [Pyrinomonadaceae bacterium]|nr:MBL fold metallo-hydrolase [Pyrinomonadaceae bacterium]